MKMNMTNKKVTVIFLCFVLFLTLYLLLTTVNDFIEAYNECVDDFYWINECECLLYEGNYSYFIKDLDYPVYFGKINISN